MRRQEDLAVSDTPVGIFTYYYLNNFGVLTQHESVEN